FLALVEGGHVRLNRCRCDAGFRAPARSSCISLEKGQINGSRTSMASQWIVAWATETAPESTGGARLCSFYRSATLPTSGRAGRESPSRLRRGARIVKESHGINGLPQATVHSDEPPPPNL